MTEKLNIGIILGSTREGRLSPQVGNWVKEIADKRGDANYEIVDIADFKLPFLGTTDGSEPGIAAWNALVGLCRLSRPGVRATLPRKC